MQNKVSLFLHFLHVQGFALAFVIFVFPSDEFTNLCIVWVVKCEALLQVVDGHSIGLTAPATVRTAVITRFVPECWRFVCSFIKVAYVVII